MGAIFVSTMMIRTEFVPKGGEMEISLFKTTWTAPSNIALVKYWGKKELQIPCNPSVSFTLDQCRTTTTVRFKKQRNAQDDVAFTIQFDEKSAPSFEPKIKTFIEILIYKPNNNT